MRFDCWDHFFSTTKKEILSECISVWTSSNGFSLFAINWRDNKLLISSNGGNVLYFKPANRHPVFWCSKNSSFENGKPVRGGVPVCYPWFADQIPPHTESASFHGLVRSERWNFKEHISGNEFFQVKFTHCIDNREWKTKENLALTVTMSHDYLCVNLDVSNIYECDIKFCTALHSYFDVEDINNISISGLGESYIDKFDGKKVKNSIPDFGLPIDAIFTSPKEVVELADYSRKRKIKIKHRGNDSCVVFNPGEALASSNREFDENVNGFICIETSLINQLYSLRASSSFNMGFELYISSL